MVRFEFGGHMRARTAALLALAVALGPVAPQPAVAEQVSAGRYVVTLVGVERFEGAVGPAAIVCRSHERCTDWVRIATRDKSYRYALSVSASAAQISLAISAMNDEAPELGDGRGVSVSRYPIRVMLEPDGTGRRDVALTAIPRLKWGRSEPYTMVMPAPAERIPVANIRVTVRREDAAQQSR